MKYYSILLAGLLGGCATQTILEDTLDITYRSDPPGAVLYAGKQNVGFSPHTARHPLSAKDKINGYITFDDYTAVTAKWPSGAEVKPEKGIRLYLGNAQRYDHKGNWLIPGDADYTRYTMMYDINRPNEYPGLQQDIGSGVVVQEIQKLKREAEQAKADAESVLEQAENARKSAQSAQSDAEETLRKAQSAKSDAEFAKLGTHACTP
jgi:hypothetical protein